MANIEIIKGTSLCLHITDIEITFDDSKSYTLTEQDGITFTLNEVTNNKRVLMQKTLGNGIDLIGQDIVISFEPSDTKELDCLAYSFDCKLDIQNKGEQVHSITSGVLSVKEK